MANKIRDKAKLFTVPAFPNPPAEYSASYIHNKDLVLRLYLQGVDEALKNALQYDSDDIIDGSIPDSKLEARYLRKDQNDETAYELTALEFIGDLRGAIVFKAKAGEDLTKGDVVYISGASGNTTVVSKADADDPTKMQGFGLAAKTASNNTNLEVYTFGTLNGLDTSSYALGAELYVSTTAGQLTDTPPTGESAALQKIAKVTRVHATSGSLKIMGAGRINSTPNLNDGNIFMGNASNIATTVSFNTKVGDYITANPITNAQLAGSIENSKLVNDSVSYGGVSLDLGQSDATPAFDLSDATNYPTSSLSGTITNAQLAGSIENAKLSNSTVSYGGVQLSLGGADATPAFDLSDATNYPAGSLTGEIGTAQIADDAVTDAKLADSINSAIAANTAKVTNATHTGEVTGATALTIADGAVVTARIDDLAVTGAKIADATITFQKMGTSSVNSTAIQPNAVTTTKIADDAVTSAKITGPFSSKHAVSNNFAQTISTTAAVTVLAFSIPAPAGGVEATQSLSASMQVRFYNSSSSSVKENHQWKVLTQMKSKTVNGTSLGTATYVSSPSSYHAWYTVSGDKTSIICSNRGSFATSVTGSNLGSLVAVYYDSASNKTWFRIIKFPDATTVYNGLEVYYSPTSFVTPGTYVSNQGFNNQYLTIGSTTAYQTVELPLMATFGRSTTATDIRIQFDHVSSTTNLNTVVTGLYGHVENTV